MIKWALVKLGTRFVADFEQPFARTLCEYQEPKLIDMYIVICKIKIRNRRFMDLVASYMEPATYASVRLGHYPGRFD